MEDKKGRRQKFYLNRSCEDFFTLLITKMQILKSEKKGQDGFYRLFQSGSEDGRVEFFKSNQNKQTKIQNKYFKQP